MTSGVSRPVRPGGPGAAQSVVYHSPRERRRWPVVLVGVLSCTALVTGQVVVGGLADAADEPAAVSQPSVRSSVGPSPSPDPDPDSSPDPAPDPDEPPAVAVPEVTVRFAVGAVLDPQAREDLAPVLTALLTPGAARVVVRGGAEPGPDEEATRQLARQRAEVVAEALVEGGAPAALVRVAAEPDPDAGRTVVVAPDVP